MKRLLFLLMAVSLLAACGNDTSKGVSDKEPVSKEETETDENVSYTTETEINFYEDNHMVVAGSTDLPDGEEVLITVVSDENDYTAADTQQVKDGIYSSEVFTKQGDALPSGEYKITIESAKGNNLKHEETITID